MRMDSLLRNWRARAIVVLFPPIVGKNLGFLSDARNDRRDVRGAMVLFAEGRWSTVFTHLGFTAQRGTCLRPHVGGGLLFRNIALGRRLLF
jgi:hypothetical protein